MHLRPSQSCLKFADKGDDFSALVPFQELGLTRKEKANIEGVQNTLEPGVKVFQVEVKVKAVQSGLSSEASSFFSGTQVCLLTMLG